FRPRQLGGLVGEDPHPQSGAGLVHRAGKRLFRRRRALAHRRDARRRPLFAGRRDPDGDRGGRAVNERSLRVLEYPKIIAMLQQRTAFAPGAELAQRLVPLTGLQDVDEALADTEEALRLLETGGPDLLAGARDVREAVRRAGVGAVLSPGELLDVAATAAAVRRVRRALLHEPDHHPRLAARAAGMAAFPELEDAVGACIGDDGDVLDRASPKLAQLRARIRSWQAKSRERLEAVLRAAAAKHVLQDAVITMRNGRYVIPVKQDQRAAVPGIVHDTSASG